MARNEEAEDKSPAQRSVEQQLGQALKEDGTVDQDALRRDHPPLAEVLDALILSKTTRDDPEEIAKDVARTLEARNPDTRLADALRRLEAQMNPEDQA